MQTLLLCFFRILFFPLYALFMLFFCWNPKGQANWTIGDYFETLGSALSQWWE